MTSSKPKKVLLLGSGGLRIGQAGEFDYSGSQAIKALKEEGIAVVLVNPNIATVQTDPSMADTLYLQPLTVETVTRIIEKEKPDGILLGFGGQTALNLGLELSASGVLDAHRVRVLGTPIAAIACTEDRELFKRALERIGVKTPKSVAVKTVDEAVAAVKTISAKGKEYPVMMRAGFSLGGLGSGKITTPEALRERAREALSAAPQILIEEYLEGWKEIEYEIVRDQGDNTITVCNMENLDPMGIHTGESIVVAPSQTLSNDEYHRLRAIAIKTARALGIIGECNIQYALHPQTGDYRVIEVNARLSRSSALASKATGYPLAFVAAKLSLGYRLDELKNAVTKKTSAFFEPALDYLVVKIPRWDTAKFKSADRQIGSEMKSVGEVMGIGRSFPEALQKAVRMLHLGADGLTEYPNQIPHPEEEIRQATDRRFFALAAFFGRGGSVARAHELSRIDPWFLHHIKRISDAKRALGAQPLTRENLRAAKCLGFSDKTIGHLKGMSEEIVRRRRLTYGIRPVRKQIDTLAGEFPAATNYLYLTYHGEADDGTPAKSKPYIILGSGPYCIGSSVEFDWCAVNTARTLRKHGKTVVMINSNPETVSTDYDESDRLYFEELTLERVRDIADAEKTKNIIVSVGGQIANNLAFPLEKSGYAIVGTKGKDIDRAENRKTFSSLLTELSIDQPPWTEVTTLARACAFARRVAYPVLVRPSYVLSGAAMNVVFSDEELAEYIQAATQLSPDHPIVLSKFIVKAKELEIDGVARHGAVLIQAISEHVEHAGVHSGDATVVLPPQRLYLETIRQAKAISARIVRALHVTGPFNIQFLAKDNDLKVIECNLRASRSFPFVAKVTGHNFIEIAARAFLDAAPRSAENYETLELPFVGVKTPQFSYRRLKGSDPITGVEMASTGEVACIGRTYLEAFLLAWTATEQRINGKRIFISIGEDKEKFIEPLRALEEGGWDIFATEGTHAVLSTHGIGSTCLFKASDGIEPNIMTIIERRAVDLIINIPRHNTRRHETDGYSIRRHAIDHHIPLITNGELAQVFLRCLVTLHGKEIPMLSWQEHMKLKE